jgi:hypothetical protein
MQHDKEVVAAEQASPKRVRSADDEGGEAWGVMSLIRGTRRGVHQRLYPYQRNGKRFDTEMLRLAGAGAFDEIW